MFIQRDAIRDYIFPLVTVVPHGDDVAYGRFLGTGFLIGSRGMALTAGHVVSAVEPGAHVAALFADLDGGWHAQTARSWEVHPTEDVAVLSLDGGPWRSFLRLAGTWEGQTLHYRLFGYPQDTLIEVVRDGRVVPRPDLIYSEGYIRRRITDLKIPTVRGAQLFELSAVAGRGCSGSPVLKITGTGPWEVIGIYVNERINDEAPVAYAVREEAFRGWTPTLFGLTVLAESQDVSTSSG